MARFFPLSSSESTLGLPKELLLPVLHGVRKNVSEIRDALAGVELRMVGGSILVIYEGDWARAKEVSKKQEEAGADEEDEDEEEDEEVDGKPTIGPLYLVKLIDFAHTKIVPGRGPDEGVLKGLDTVLELLDGRINTVKQS